MKRTQRPPIDIDGVVFLSYQTGISQYCLISEDGSLKVYRNAYRFTYSASFKIIGKRFQSDKTAMKAAVKYARNLP
jgi:hypothetical protein